MTDTYNIEGRETKILSPLKAIRANCLACTCGYTGEIRECNIPNCPLWPYRMGVRPLDCNRTLRDHMDVSNFKDDWEPSFMKEYK